MRKLLRSTLIIFIFGFIIAACDSQSSALSSPPSLQTWIDAPLDGSKLTLAPYEIVVHGSDPAGITTLEISVNGEIHITQSNSSPEDLLVMTQYTWTPPHPGDFTIQARSQNSSSAWSDPASVSVKVVAEIPTPQALTLNPTPTPELALTACDPTAQALMNATCRSGPTSFHTPTAYLIEGDEAVIIGRNQDRSWWFVQIPGEEISCWLADQTVFIVCVPGGLIYKPSPPYIIRIIKSGSEFYWGDNPNKYITIQAQLGGDSSITNARVVYRLKEKSAWQGFALTNTSSDIWKGSLYSRNVNGYKNVSAAFIEYYLEATNKDGLTTRSELFSDIKLKEVP